MSSFTLSENTYYKDFIHENCPSTTSKELTLSFFHTCRGENFRKIITKGALEATKCKEFNENLLYLFYGRPAYRISSNKTSRDLGAFPVCFIINKDAAQNVRRIFPFDSGAFLGKILDEYIGEFSTKEEYMSALAGYDLGDDLNDLARFISTLYGNDKQYLETIPVLQQEELKGMCFELSRILDMARSFSSKTWDNRALTSEVQINSSIEFSGISVEAVIIPVQYISGDENLQEFLYNEDINVITYNVTRMKPENATELIDYKAKEFYEKKGLAQ